MKWDSNPEPLMYLLFFSVLSDRAFEYFFQDCVLAYHRGLFSSSNPETIRIGNLGQKNFRYWLIFSALPSQAFFEILLMDIILLELLIFLNGYYYDLPT